MREDGYFSEMDRDFVREILAEICKRTGLDFHDVATDAASAIAGKYGGSSDAPDVVSEWGISP